MERVKIAFLGPKGVGKTSLAMIFGTLLQETYGKSVCYVDGNYDQKRSLLYYNKREESFIEQNQALVRELYESRGLDFSHRTIPQVYEIESSYSSIGSSAAEEEADDYNDYDVYIYDFKEAVSNMVLDAPLMMCMDYIVLPTILTDDYAFTTHDYMRAIAERASYAIKRGLCGSLKGVYLLFNQFNADTSNPKLKLWLEQEADKAGYTVLQNTVGELISAYRDLSSITKDYKNIYASLHLRPSRPYLEETNVHFVAEEFFSSVGIIQEKYFEAHPIMNPFELYKDVIEDLKNQLDEMEWQTRSDVITNESFLEKYREISALYQSMCAMSEEEILNLFGRNSGL